MGALSPLDAKAGLNRTYIELKLAGVLNNLIQTKSFRRIAQIAG